jgi:RNA polymerase sigma factor (sigma-70 family)
MHQHAIDAELARFRATVVQHEAAALPDDQLLELCLAGRDEAAFSALVRRHGPMVFAVCRRVLAHHQDAEDAFQATFLVFLRKVSCIRPRSNVANWLYGVAYRAALKAQAAALRRSAREKQVSRLPEPVTVEDGLWSDVLPLLDQELHGLPEKYRLPIVLCDLQGKTRKEAARQLGWPEGTVAGRLYEGRALLAKRLARHGLPVSGGVLAALLAQHALAAVVSKELLGVTLQTSRAMLAGASLPPALAAITQGVLGAMVVGKLKWTAWVLAVLALTVLGGTLLVQGQSPADLGVRSLAAQGENHKAAQEAIKLEGKTAPAVGKNTDQAAGPQPDKELQQELKKLQGGWWWSTVEQFGNNPVFGFPFDYYYVFQGDQFVAYDRLSHVERHKGTIKVDPAEHTIDLILGEGKDKVTWLAARYGWKGNLLRLAFDPQPGMPRPRELKSAPGSTVQVWTCLPLELQGTWKVTSHVTNGKAAGPEFLARDHQWTFAGYAVATKDKGGPGRQGTFTFDPTAPLKTLELTLKPGLPPGPGVVPQEEFSLCIYKVEGDSLTICYPISPNKERPREFRSTAEPATGLLTLQRALPEKAEDKIKDAVEKLGARYVVVNGHHAIQWHKATDAALKQLPDIPYAFELSLGPKVTEDALKDLRRFPKLTTLELMGKNWTGTRWKELEGLENLQELHVEFAPNLGDGDWRPLRQLRELSLDGTQATGAGLKELVNLRRLNISNSPKFADAGMREVGELKNLEALWLDGTAVGDAGLWELRTLRNLKELVIRDSKVTRAGLEKLQKSLPQLTSPQLVLPK